MIGQYEAATTSVSLDPESRCALRIFRENGLMTIGEFSAAMWPVGTSIDPSEYLDGLCRAGFVEPILRPVGPLRFGLTSDGLDKVLK
jgi:hypothetical protein